MNRFGRMPPLQGLRGEGPVSRPKQAFPFSGARPSRKEGAVA